MYEVTRTQAYRKAYKRVSKQKDFSLETLEAVILTLRQGERIDAKYRDHQLTGEMKEYRECHIKNDILLMYQKYEDVLVLLLVDLGTHDELFG